LKIDRDRLAFYSETSKSPEPEIFVRSLQDGTIAHIRNFLDCVRSRKAPTANIRVAHEAARASHLGNLSLKTHRKVKWNVQQGRLES
jgi:hypothetical protein